MLTVYFGDADKDKDKFIFDRIASVMPSDVFLLVPDQFTLQAERNAFQYMNADALLELEIVSRSGFTRRIVSQEGRPGGIAVDKYGRFMLLTKLLIEDDAENTIFSSVRTKNSFISMMNDMISDMKQYDVEPDELAEIEANFQDDAVLCEKLKDVRRIYEKYAEAVSEKYMDSEDFLRIVAEKIYYSEMVKSHVFWIDGFDYMTPKLLSMVEAIACTAPEVNIVFTGDDKPEDDTFAIFRRMQKSLREMAERNGIVYREYEIPEKYRKAEKPPKVVLTACGDFYAEAETAAVRIMELVRERGMRYRDIVIICNDAQVRGSVFRRVFDRYGIPLFIDRKRSILQEPAVEFIFAMMDTVRNGRRFHDVFRMLKTGYGPIDDDACEELENYCSKYHIKSGRWKKPFIYGVKDEGEEALNRLNEDREKVHIFIEQAEKLFRKKKTVREKTEALWTFLTETARMPEKIDMARAALEKNDEFEYAESAAQIWTAILSIFDQIVEVLGEEEMSDEEYSQILLQGFSEMEIGLLPTTNDQIIFGTMQRTRTGRMKALFVCGANEGVLPETSAAWGIFSEDEKQLISEKNRRICKTDELRDMEQQLAMYKMLSRAEDVIYVSWSELDTEGGELRPSDLVMQLREERAQIMADTEALSGGEHPSSDGAYPSPDGLELFSDDEDEAENTAASVCRITEERDVFSSEDVMRLIQTKKGALPHLAQALRKAAGGQALSDEWKAASVFYDGEPSYENVKKGLFFDNKVERIEKNVIKELYGRGISKELILSASSLERFCRCPFSFMISYGLRPTEARSFEVDIRSIGDIYHSCLMRLSEYLTEEGQEITDPASRWMTISQEECRKRTDQFVDEFADTYREGVFLLEGREKYIRSRVREVCFRTAWMMIRQVRSGKTKAIYFERGFGRRADALFPPVKIDLGSEGCVYIEGVIDRVDIFSAAMEEEEKTYIKIVDYKSGGDKFEMEDVRNGFRLQLMLYLKGAMGGIEGAYPAGVFYFKIHDDMAEVSDIPEEQVAVSVQESMQKGARLDGVVLAEQSVIECIDADFTEYSDIIPVKRKKDGSFMGSKLLSEEEFSELIAENDANLERAASGFLAGKADIEPMRGKSTDACRFCGFRSICNIQQTGLRGGNA